MGDVASSLVVDSFKDDFVNQNITPEDFLSFAIENAQKRLIDEQTRLDAKKKMKTTAVALNISDDKAFIVHSGDSRCYVFSRNKVLTRTIDHSVPQMLALSNQIEESEIRNHPDRNIVLKVLGVDWETPQYEKQEPLKLKKCQAFLLCSDGFWELILEEKMCEFLKSSRTVEEWLLKMSEEVKLNGKGKRMDNFSAIAVWREDQVVEGVE